MSKFCKAGCFYSPFPVILRLMYDPAAAERKREKKIRRLLKKSAWAAGMGIGLIILRFIVAPYLGENEAAQDALFIFGWCLIGYGAATVLSFMFLRAHIFKINIALSWVIMPLIFIKLLTGVL